MYQTCPVCRGKGVFKKDPCPVCLGERIIHEDYGTPPSKNIAPYVVTYPWFPTNPSEQFYVTATLSNK